MVVLERSGSGTLYSPEAKHLTLIFPTLSEMPLLRKELPVTDKVKFRSYSNQIICSGEEDPEILRVGVDQSIQYLLQRTNGQKGLMDDYLRLFRGKHYAFRAGKTNMPPNNVMDAVFRQCDRYNIMSYFLWRTGESIVGEPLLDAYNFMNKTCKDDLPKLQQLIAHTKADIYKSRIDDSTTLTGTAFFLSPLVAQDQKLSTHYIAHYMAK